jgi:hypothetical protein
MVASRDVAAHLHQLFERLEKFGLVINAEKCVFAMTSVDFLGHTVSVKGIKPLASHTAALIEHPMLNNIKQLHVFLGLVNFYRLFIPQAALGHPLLQQARRNTGRMVPSHAEGSGGGQKGHSGSHVPGKPSSRC